MQFNRKIRKKLSSLLMTSIVMTTVAFGSSNILTGAGYFSASAQDSQEAGSQKGNLEGFIKQNGKWYLYKNNVQQRKWQEYNGVKYYLLNTYTLPQNMWRNIDGKYYYFNKDGVMIMDQKIKIGGKIYQFDANGVNIPLDSTTKLDVVKPEVQAIYNQGEKNLIEAAKAQSENKNISKNGVFKEDGKWYRYENGKKVRGFYTTGNGNTYFFLNTYNRAENMFRVINGKKYYFDKNGVMYKNRIANIGGQLIKFNKDGSINPNAKLTVIARKAVVYEGVSKSTKQIAKLSEGEYIELFERKGNRVRISTSGGRISGWIDVDKYMSKGEEKVKKVIDIAKSKIGSPYVWGATGPNAFDCSGLMTYSFYNGAGISLPRVSKNQANVGTYVSRANLKPGDLIFWGNPIHHVGLYIGGDKYVHAPEPGVPVKISQLGSYTTARRIIQ